MTTATKEKKGSGKAAKLSTIEGQFQAARRCGTPILAIATPDAFASQARLKQSVKDKDSSAPIFSWDLSNGLLGINEAGKVAIKSLDATEVEMTAQNPTGALVLAAKLPGGSVLFFHLANRLVGEPPVLQAIANLRDVFKQDKRTLVLLSVGMTLPPEIAGDIIAIDEPLPNREQLEAIIRELHTAGEIQQPSAENMTRAVDAVMGLPAFQAEQCAAMCLSRKGLDIEALWERKRKQVEQTPGLSISREGIKFADLGGLSEVKSYMLEILNGNDPPNAIVFLDEIEKVVAGSRGDTSGVSQDQLQQLLTHMQDENAVGVIFNGHPGTGKSAAAKAAGNEAGIPTIKLDLGGTKNELVGGSEARLRTALKVIKSVSNGRALWIATSNGLDEIKPELLARFKLGIIFFDLPDAEERGVIWNVHRTKYGIDPQDAAPPSENWVGREIEACCEIAYRTNKPLATAAVRIVPSAQNNPTGIQRLQSRADGRWLAAGKPGVYRMPGKEPVEVADSSGPRSLSLE